MDSRGGNSSVLMISTQPVENILQDSLFPIFRRRTTIEMYRLGISPPHKAS
jgi:hypothetical protein